MQSLNEITELIQKRIKLFEQIEYRQKEINKLRYQQKKDKNALKNYDAIIFEKAKNSEFEKP